MDLNNAVWLYCERGTSTALLAEPVNAVTSLFSIFAGLAALWIYRKLPAGQKSADHTLLMGLSFAVGLGALAFHLFASQWSELAHLLPFLLFLLVFMAFALNRFLDVPAGWTGLILAILTLFTVAGLTMTCLFLDQALQPPWSLRAGASGGASGGATSCLNGSLGYVPFALALMSLGFLLRARGHKAAPSVILAGVVFIVSLAFHTIDHLACTQLSFWGRAIGSHFLWHMGSAAVLMILMRTAMLHQEAVLVQEILPPDPKYAKKCNFC